MESIIGQLIIALTLLSQTLTNNTALAQVAEASTLSTTTPITIATTKKDKVLDAISKCESHNTQFNPDGTVLRGIVNNKDVGYFQINEYYHLDTSRKLGMDIYTLEGNVAYANYLYEKEGTKPWNSSKYCWGKLAVDS